MGFKSNSDSWFRRESETLKRAEKMMAQVMVNRAKMLAPVDTGALVQSGRVQINPDGSVSAIFGGGDVPYALRRHFENKKNPQTLNYLKRAGDSVVKEGAAKYIKMSRI